MKAYNTISCGIEIDRKALEKAMKGARDPVWTLIDMALSATDYEITGTYDEAPAGDVSLFVCSPDYRLYHVDVHGVVESFEADEDGECVDDLAYDWDNVSVDFDIAAEELFERVGVEL